MRRIRAAAVLLVIIPSMGVAAEMPEPDAQAFTECIADMRSAAREAGIAERTIRASLDDLRPNEQVLALDRRQPEFLQTFWQYMDVRVTEDRIKRGRELLEEHGELLHRIAAEFEVRPHYIVALWGLETNFGSYFGDFPVIQAVATLACDRRRSDFFRSELLHALDLIDDGKVEPGTMKGSWAGAMGHTQFMPSTFKRHAVDYDGSGRPELWTSLPDAFASAANYLRAMDWRDGERWGREVSLPADFPWHLAGRDRDDKPVSEWASLGVRATDGGRLPDSEMQASLLLPAGHQGPAFLVYHNFGVIMRWNPSVNFALAVGHLADRIAGMGALRAEPPGDVRPLRIDEVREIQMRLTQLGFDSGPADGRVGPMTRGAIRDYQKQMGLAADGHPDEGLLERLRDEQLVHHRD